MKKKIIGILVVTIFTISVFSTIIGSAINEAKTIVDDSLEIDNKDYKKVLKDVPPQWNWREIDGEDWTTPIKDQLQDVCGSCWAFGALGGVESNIKIWEDNPDLDVDLAEQYILSCSSTTTLLILENIYSSGPSATPIDKSSSKLKTSSP